MSKRHATAAAWALTVAQVVHGIVPAKTSEHSAVGPIAGLVLLIASTTAIIAIGRGWERAHVVLGATGIAVSIGFVLYHALPWHSPFTRPYFGEPVGVPAWSTVAVAIATGLWAAVVGFGHRPVRADGDAQGP